MKKSIFQCLVAVLVFCSYAQARPDYSTTISQTDELSFYFAGYNDLVKPEHGNILISVILRKTTMEKKTDKNGKTSEEPKYEEQVIGSGTLNDGFHIKIKNPKSDQYEVLIKVKETRLLAGLASDVLGVARVGDANIRELSINLQKIMYITAYEITASKSANNRGVFTYSFAVKATAPDTTGEAAIIVVTDKEVPTAEVDQTLVDKTAESNAAATAALEKVNIPQKTLVVNYSDLLQQKRITATERSDLKIDEVNDNDFAEFAISKYQNSDIVKGEVIYQNKTGKLMTVHVVVDDHVAQTHLLSYDPSDKYIDHILVCYRFIYRGDRRTAVIQGDKIMMTDEQGNCEKDCTFTFEGVITPELKFVKNYLKQATVVENKVEKTPAVPSQETTISSGTHEYDYFKDQLPEAYEMAVFFQNATTDWAKLGLRGKVKSVREMEGNQPFEVFFNETGQISKIESAKRGIKTFSYSGGKLTKITERKADGKVQETVFRLDAKGHISAEDADFKYTQNGTLVEAGFSTWRWHTLTFDEKTGLLIKEIPLENNSIENLYEYDAKGRCIKKTSWIWVDEAEYVRRVQECKYTYNAQHDIVRKMCSCKEVYEFAPSKNCQAYSPPLPVRYTYDEQGNWTVSSEGRKRTFEYYGSGFIFPGSGTRTEPFEISTAVQLARLAELVNAGNTHYLDKQYKLIADIDLSVFGSG